MTTKKRATKKAGIPVIVCVGTPGRAVVYGLVDAEPSVGGPVTLRGARMVLRWDAACGGLFGLAATGPAGDTRITAPVAVTGAAVVSEWVAVSPAAAAAIDGWAPWRG